MIDANYFIDVLGFRPHLSKFEGCGLFLFKIIKLPKGVYTHKKGNSTYIFLNILQHRECLAGFSTIKRLYKRLQQKKGRVVKSCTERNLSTGDRCCLQLKLSERKAKKSLITAKFKFPRLKWTFGGANAFFLSHFFFFYNSIDIILIYIVNIL